MLSSAFCGCASMIQLCLGHCLFGTFFVSSLNSCLSLSISLFRNDWPRCTLTPAMITTGSLAIAITVCLATIIYFLNLISRNVASSNIIDNLSSRCSRLLFTDRQRNSPVTWVVMPFPVVIDYNTVFTSQVLTRLTTSEIIESTKPIFRSYPSPFIFFIAIIKTNPGQRTRAFVISYNLKNFSILTFVRNLDQLATPLEAFELSFKPDQRFLDNFEFYTKQSFCFFIGGCELLLATSNCFDVECLGSQVSRRSTSKSVPVGSRSDILSNSESHIRIRSKLAYNISCSAST